MASRLLQIPERFSPTQLADHVEFALHEATRLGATAAEASLSLGQGLGITVRKGEIETLEHHRDRGLSITVYQGQRKGSASTSELTPAGLRATVNAALGIARYTAEDPYAGLAPAELLANSILDLQLDHPWDLSTAAAIQLAKECEAAALRDPLITNSEGASVSIGEALSLYGNTHGFLGGYAGTRHSISCSVIASDAQGLMERDYWFSTARYPAALETAEAIGLQAAARAKARLGGQRIPTGQVPVLFAPEAARSLIGNFLGAIRGSALYRQSSFLVDSLGKNIFPTFVKIHEQPHLLKALGSAPFDSEGVATQARTFVEQGILQSYVLNSYSARRLGLITTANAGGVRNLQVESTGHSFTDLLRVMNTGLLVTELMGQGVNLVTGDYSRGAAGFWIENGEIAYPVQEITIAGQLPLMFQNIEAIGNDIDRRSNVCTGSILLKSMMIAGE
ncbi:MAG: metalloprotease PmbA [Gammaproteobacteria bacterium]|nr:metalloprotease PmbA [Gammaproteobacteria bacterium]